MAFHRFLLLILVHLVSPYPFTDDNWNSFDAYGVKLAANDVVIVQARNNDAKFIVQFGPFNTSSFPLPCYIDYVGITTGDKNFIYNLVVPHQTYDTYDGEASVVFVGENDDNSTSPNPFVGHLRAKSSCDITYDMHLFVQWKHDEFYVVGIDPTGTVAYGFSTEFAFSYDLQTHTVTFLQGWPIPSFTPRAVDLNSDHHAVMAGFMKRAQYTYKPLIYLLKLDINSSNITDTFLYMPANSSWQAMTSNSDAANFTTKHAMSVAVHDATSQALVGMPSMNIGFWFNVTVNLYLVGNRANGYQRGYGQSVGWNDAIGGPYPVLLGNTYSFPYEWSASAIYWYTSWNFILSVSYMPLFPTDQFPRWIELSQEIITVACTSLNVVVLDSIGQMYVLLATPEGSYPGTSNAIGFNPVFSSTKLCQAGTYRNWVGLDICYPCPPGTMSEFEGSINCLSYDCDETDSFCPLGSTTNDTYSDLIITVSQAQAYPTSPDTTNFDDILIQNMFTFGHSIHCLIVSPVFWTLVMTGIGGFLLLFMGILKFFHRWVKVRVALKRVFQQIDLIKEGEVWIGGLASFGLIILVGFAYLFSNAYLQQYPIETSSTSTFICDTSLRNAQFSTNLQSLSTPHTEEEQTIFNMLDKQQFTLSVDFINTKYTCDTVSVTQIIYNNPVSVVPSCKYNRSVLSISLVLESHAITLNYDFDGVLLIGGLRISLWSEQQEASNALAHTQYLVRELNFKQPFFINNQTMASNPSIDLSVTRVINITAPLSADGSYLYNALWIPSSSTNLEDLFLTMDEFMYYGLLKPSLSVSISETTYFIQNTQEPIAKQAEIIFHDLIFTIVSLELFGLAFLIMKLIFLPFFKLVRRFIEKRFHLVHPQPVSNSRKSVANNFQEKRQSILFKSQPKKITKNAIGQIRTAWIAEDDAD